MKSDFMTTIGEVAEVFDGPHATPTKVEHGPYFLSISSLENGSLDLSRSAHLSQKDFKKWTRRITPKSGDVLFSYETRLGEAALMPPDVTACLGRRMGLLRPKRNKVIPEYLLYAYLSPQFQETIRAKTIHGATVDRIALKELPDFPIRIPSLDEQRDVVKVLNALNLKLELNRQTNQTLEQIAQAIFKSWFVDFDPVRAKIAAREAFIQQHPEVTEEAIRAAAGTEGDTLAHAGAKACEVAAICAISGKTGDELNEFDNDTLQQLKDTAALFPDVLVDSELGEMPGGWKKGNVGDISNVKGGYAYKSKEFLDEGFPVVKIKNIVGNGTVDLTACQCVSDELAVKTERFILKDGDLLMAMTGATVGKVGLVVLNERSAFLNQRVAKFESEYFGSKVSWFLYILFQRESIFELIVGTALGSAQPNISASGIESITFLVPPDTLLAAYCNLVDALFNCWMNNNKEERTLVQLRNNLLPKLLSGEI